MKPRNWAVFTFTCLQLIGAAGGIGGLYWLQDPIFWGLSLLLLLPGTLVAWPFSNLGHAGTNWPFWTVYAIAIPFNAILFATVTFLIRLRRKSRS